MRAFREQGIGPHTERPRPATLHRHLERVNQDPELAT